MAANTNRYSTYTTASTGSDSRNGEKEKKELWSSMLDSVASAKRLPEKNILLLGGSVDSQREFFESLSRNELRRNTDRQGSRKPPIANSFALGYTYYDVLDADQEDTLARISLYTLTDPSPAFASLIQPLITPQSIPNTLIVILLDWSQPWKWMRQLREWILLLRTVFQKLNRECSATMEEVMTVWRERGRGGGLNLDGTSAVPTTSADADVSLPVGPGEWEDALANVMIQAEKMDHLEKTQGWKEEEFDVVLQFLRTILLRLHSSLGIHSLLKKQPLKHNVIDRDKILVPPNWDSWGKIRVLREGFDVEAVSSGWTADLSIPWPRQPQRVANGDDQQQGETNDNETGDEEQELDEDEYEEPTEPDGSSVALYEASVQDPTMDALHIAGSSSHSTKLEVQTTETQQFLEKQLKLLDVYKQKNEEPTGHLARIKSARKTTSDSLTAEDDHLKQQAEAKVLEHIGPVQFNMGGIQVDADDMLQRLKERQAFGTSPEPLSPEDETVEETPQMDTENLQAFFTGLMNRSRQS
ncbi:hypothetical protein NEUTE1DRAFT_106145 [Neurospora tetrasperma FGSC 2508]|uniref:Dynein light intermediate chain n=1 Tax=Neurospora tetrasperma (strain FGSC 2508 / ATCC MYA-4615 / P0657) TaxID=510951 RepID=F8N1Y7_NEUT8|nr:uncharacterized protein NEUTE1DRAFT_106145 [Neurospora tetrasperma FGSC 2508]EGO53211.1 hypothetical protein NEUTE1DRAFT_106145 [Neurospora tetrasperma FGSC 2508]